MKNNLQTDLLNLKKEIDNFIFIINAIIEPYIVCIVRKLNRLIAKK